MLAACGSAGQPSGTATSAATAFRNKTRDVEFSQCMNACKQYLPNGGEPPATPPADRAAALAFARCMRAHGLSGFPDPAMTPPTGSASVFSVFVVHGMVFAFATQIDPKSPAFRQAAHACGVSKA